MEYSNYEATYQLDCNNYIAIKDDGTVKSKGRFVTPAPGKNDLRHAPQFNICADAVKEFLQHGIPVDETIAACTDIQSFILTQKVVGDWTTSWQGTPLGKMVRFYKSTAPHAAPVLRHPGTSGTVKGNEGVMANSESCVPVQDLPATLPPDIDYDWYIDTAEKWLLEIVRPKREGENARAYNLQHIGLTPAVVSTDPTARSSRAQFSPGTVDWNALEPGQEMGISTGPKVGILAVVDAVTMCNIHLYHFNGPLPSKTRKKVGTDEGWHIIYGANIRLAPGWVPGQQLIEPIHQDALREWYGAFYTPAELKKAKVPGYCDE